MKELQLKWSCNGAAANQAAFLLMSSFYSSMLFIWKSFCGFFLVFWRSRLMVWRGFSSDLGVCAPT